MKWVLWILGGLVVAVGIVAAVGAMLPVRHVATRKARYQVDPDALYAILVGPPDWRPDVKAFGDATGENGTRRWWEADSHGKKVTFEQVAAQPGKRLEVRIADKGLPFGGTWTYDIAPVAGGGSELRITEDGEVYNVIFRFVSKFVMGHHSSIEAFLKNLGAKLGQPVEIEA
jgi:hypothetical protein